MLKKIITYSGLFIAVFLLGMLLAFGWSKLCSKKHVEPSMPHAASPHVSGPTPTRPAALTHSTAPALSSVKTPSPSSGEPPAHALRSSSVRSAPGLSPAPSTAPSPLPVRPVEAKHDIILLIDSSGSMKRTDPGNYRKEAAKLFISLLDKDDRVGVIGFGDAATVLMPLTQNARQNRNALMHAVTKISSRELTTDITAALRKGLSELKPDPSRQGIIIMLSDGKIDLGSKDKDDASFAHLKLLLPELARSNVKLYTVAFTEQSDSSLLESMAKETGGAFRFAREDKDVHTMFSSIFEKIKSPDILPFEGESFTIDREIREATILATKKAKTILSLIDPSHQKHLASKHAPNIAWFDSSVFDMITIQEPAAGAWSVKLSTSEGNKVYILTNLSLKTSFEKSFVERGSRVTIEAWLEKQGGLVSEKDVLENTALSVEVTYPDRSVKKFALHSAATATGAPPVRGTYSVELEIAPAGEYALKLLALGKTFKREKNLTFRTVEPAATPAPAKQEPPPAQPHQSEKKEVSWTRVLLQFTAVNVVIIVLAALGLFIRKKIAAKRTAK